MFYFFKKRMIIQPSAVYMKNTTTIKLSNVNELATNGPDKLIKIPL